VRVIEHVRGHYEVQDVEMGKVYRWRPESVMVECECGERPTLTAAKTTCPKCGSDRVGIVGEVLEARPEDEIEHPWRSLRPYYKPTRGT
jgi:hypothetical protein